MTYEEFIASLADHNRPPRWRKGQFAFNALHDARPDISEELRTSCLDPFYNDNRIPAFLEAVASMWNLTDQP